MEDQLMSLPDGRDNEPALITIDCCMLYCDIVRPATASCTARESTDIATFVLATDKVMVRASLLKASIHYVGGPLRGRGLISRLNYDTVSLTH